MSHVSVTIEKELHEKTMEIKQLLDKREGAADYQLRKALEKLISLYVYQVQNELVDVENGPLVTDHNLTQTETAIFVDHLLKQMDIEIFEIQMWRSMK